MHCKNADPKGSSNEGWLRLSELMTQLKDATHDLPKCALCIDRYACTTIQRKVNRRRKARIEKTTAKKQHTAKLNDLTERTTFRKNKIKYFPLLVLSKKLGVLRRIGRFWHT